MDIHFVSLGYLPRSGVGGWYRNSTFNCLRHFQTVLQSGYAMLYSPPPKRRRLPHQHLLVSDFLILASLVGVKGLYFHFIKKEWEIPTELETLISCQVFSWFPLVLDDCLRWSLSENVEVALRNVSKLLHLRICQGHRPEAGGSVSQVLPCLISKGRDYALW